MRLLLAFAAGLIAGLGIAGALVGIEVVRELSQVDSSRGDVPRSNSTKATR